MNTSTLRNFAQAARIRLLDDVKNRFLFWGIDKDGNITHRIETTTGGFIFRDDVYNDKSIPNKWDNLYSAVKTHSPIDIIEEAAYTWFNRLMAIKILEKNGHSDPVLSYASEDLNEPAILRSAKRGNMPKMDENYRQELNRHLSESNDDEALAILLIHYCKDQPLLNSLFGQIDDYTELLLPTSLLSRGGIIELINNEEYISADDYKEVELIGWLYQFYIADKKDDVFASFKKKQKARAEDIPAATQIFTPKWIVKYLVENTAGRIWLDKHKESPIRDTMKYLVEPEDAEPSDPIIDDVEELKVLDPAVGSGHFLVVAFDLLMQMYLESGYSKSNAVESIITHNLYGLDLCKRAVGLANFAVLLKGASYSPDILTKQIKPHIYAMLEPYEFSRQQINDFLGGNGHHYADELEDALTQMQQAQNIGSALVINLSSSARDFISDRLNELNHDAIPLDEQMLLNVITPFLHPILMLTDSYPAVVANPPYMGSKSMNTDLKDYLGTHYPKSKSDLFAVFMEVLPNLTIKNGNFGIINLPSWLFLSTYEKIRDDYISDYFIMNMLHFGRGIFGIDWGSVAFTVKKYVCGDRNGQYFKLHERTFQHIHLEDIEKLFQYSYKNPDYKYNFKKYRDEDGTNEIPELGTETGQHIFYPNVSQNDFSKIPGNPIAYWISERIIEVFEKEKVLDDYAEVITGMTTGNNNKYLKRWHEVSFIRINLNKKMMAEIDLQSQNWIPYNKGGNYRKWYGNNEYIVNWQLSNNFNRPKSTLTDLYLLEGITWSFLTSSYFSSRYFTRGFLWDVAGSPIFINNDSYLHRIIGFLTTKMAHIFLNIMNPTLNFQGIELAKLPIIFSETESINISIDSIVAQGIELSKSDWDSNELSWDFEELPLLNNSSSLPESYLSWEEKVTEDFFKLHENEEELNRIFIDIYGLEDELTPDVALKDITILQEELDRGELESRNGELLSAKTGLPIKKDVMIKQLLSYATGCFMGRYRLDKPGLNIAHPGPKEEELSAYSYHDQTFEIDDDGIIPTMGSDSPFSDDIVARTREFIQMVWGDESLTENLNFINEALGENIEKYLTKKFWADHKKTYKKKPIYWEFASPKGAFKVIAYMHRMNRFTLQKIRQNYLFKQMTWLEQEIDHLEQNEATLSSTDGRRLDNLRGNLIECREYDLVLKDVSDRQIEFDLDEGVTENYKLFDGVVSKI